MDILRLLKIALLVAVTGALTTATVLMVTQGRVPATEVGPAPCLDGDVNGDSSLDIGDPIFLLGHLFGGGPAPIACAQTTPVTGLPDTGQATCFGGSGVIECATASCGGQDGAYDTGCSSVGRFVDNADGTVTDACTGLMWQQTSAANDMVWCDALAYCEALILSGYTDWRLPSVRELQSIVDYGTLLPAIDAVFGATGILYWSSTSYQDDPGGAAFFVGFDVGNVNTWPKSVGARVRAVRTAE